MIKEIFKISFSHGAKKDSEKKQRFVVITGKDLLSFASMLRSQAATARAEGDMRRAANLESHARTVARSKKFTVEMNDETQTATARKTS